MINDSGDLRQLAGLLEGEGCFDSRGNSPRIRLKMRDYDVVFTASFIMDSTTPLRVEEKRHAHWSDMWETQLNGEKAALVMGQLLPYMSARRKEAMMSALQKWQARAAKPRVAVTKLREVA